MEDKAFEAQVKETVIKEEVVYSGHIIDVVDETVVLSDGRKTHRDIVHHAGAVAILALTADDKMIVEKQWRAPVRKVTLEIPAGKLDERDHGDALAAVNRELNEEVRLQAGNIKKFAGFYSSIGFADEYMHLYLATDLHPVTTELPQDADENIGVVYLSFDEATALYEAGLLDDGKTVVAYQYWKIMRLEQGLK
ncbi:NUDIX hydrolase [Weissella soli]|uniref:NUDIX hydrolase n=1 Tax=Weissella soli TaxID=155866 RepID=UPI0021C166C7|nr:NUDIX hydrolase [Weissella soli]MCT8395310.1 NUDIX hydrolase [Weissella soli]